MRTSTILFFFFTATPTTTIYTLSLHDALPIYSCPGPVPRPQPAAELSRRLARARQNQYRWWPYCPRGLRSEEHTSELQSHHDLVCRLLLEKKKKEKNDSSYLDTS